MRIRTTSYEDQQREWPKSGRHILAHYNDHSVIVYQAYPPRIGQAAVQNGSLYNRAPWRTFRIRPSFVYTMNRSSWGAKPKQEVTLAVRLSRVAFDTMLRTAVPWEWDSTVYATRKLWQQALTSASVTHRWDRDRIPNGDEEERHAIELTGWVDYRHTIVSIEDISEFVAEQRGVDISRLKTPVERVYPVAEEIARRLGLDH